MKDKFLEIKNYIDEIKLDENGDHFEYDHFPFIQQILDNFTAKRQDDFIENVFIWSDFQMYIISYFLDFTSFKLKGKYNSGYVFCECFSKINNVEYLKYLAESLELQLILCQNKNELSIEGIINNLYLVINNIQNKGWAISYLKMIEDLNK